MDQKAVETLVKTSVEAMIIQAFKDAPEAIDALVKSALEREVDEHGGKPDHYTRKKMPYLEWLVGSVIRDVAVTAVREAVKQREEDIRKAVFAKVSSEAIVNSLVEKIIGATTEDWKLNVSFKDDD